MRLWLLAKWTDGEENDVASIIYIYTSQETRIYTRPFRDTENCYSLTYGPSNEGGTKRRTMKIN